MVEWIEARSLLNATGNFNLYRGCTHGCIYCDSRSTCYRNGDFETIKVKADAAKLLQGELERKKEKRLLRTGGMSDPYVHLEEKLGTMRTVLKVIHTAGFGISVLTKSALVSRDLDLYKKIDERYKAIVQMTITTTSDTLASQIEPRVSPPSERLAVLKAYSDQGITTGIWMTPLLPFLTDTKENIIAIVKAAQAAGVTFIRHFGIGTTMREGSREYFYQQLDTLFPHLKSKYQKTYGNRYICASLSEKELSMVFETACKHAGILYKPEEIDALFKKNIQLKLF